MPSLRLPAMPPEHLISEDTDNLARHRALTDYLHIFLRRRLTFVGIFLIVVPLTALYCFTCTPRYAATAQLLIERHLPRVLDTEASQIMEASGQEFYQTQYKLLESRAVAQRVIKKLNLTQHPDFAPRFAEPAVGREMARRQALSDLTDWLLRRLTVIPIRRSSLVNVTFTHPDPEFAARAANAFARAYIEMSLDLRFAASQEAALWLQQKLLEARQKLEESEAKLNDYKRQHHIAAAEDKETITAQKLEQLNRELVAAQIRRLAAEARYQEVRRGHPVKEIQESPLIQTLKAEEAGILQQLSELGRKYGEKHPRMIQLRQELAATRSKIAAETRNIAQTLKNEYQIAKNQEDRLKAALQAAKKEIQDLNRRAVTYRMLLRDVETNRALYENLLKSLKETTATENLPAVNLRIVHPAVVPTHPVSPRTTRNLILASLLALVLGAVLAVVVDNLDTTLRTPEELESCLNLPNLAVIPQLELSGPAASREGPGLVVNQASRPPVIEAFRSLRTSILFSAPGGAPRNLLVTSALPREGKTFVVANLAAVLAQTEPGVVLVDADLRRPTLHRLFGLEQEPGLSNFLVGETSELPIRATAVPQLFLVPAGRVPPNPSELLHSAGMQEFLRRALAGFSRVLLDSPPVLTFTDAAILAAFTEGVLLVVRSGSVPRRAALEARDHLQEVRGALLGTVLNAAPVPRLGTYYEEYHYPGAPSPRSAGFPANSPPGAETSLKHRLSRRLHDYFHRINGLPRKMS